MDDLVGQAMIEVVEEERVRVDSTCPQCGGTDVRVDTVRAAFFEGERLAVVEDVPALVCTACGGQYYEDTTVVLLDLLRGAGFPEERARGEIRVPVFSFNDALSTRAE